MIDDADDTRLYDEVSALAKSLSLDRPHRSSSPEPSSLSRYWNPLKLLPRLRRRRLDCRFSLHVHSITSLPPSLASTALRVHWKHSTAAHTNPARAVCGTAQFDEILTERCSVYGNRSWPHRSAAYETRPFLLYATVESDPYIDLGRHRVDLARLLPVSLEEQSSGEWSTSFRLSGKATGASLNVSFGFSLAVESNSRRNWKVKSSNQQRSGRCEGPGQLQRSWSCFRGQSVDVSDSLLEYSELKNDSQSSVEVSGELSPELKYCMDEGDEPDYVVIDKGIELEDGCMKLDSAMPELETVFSTLSVRHEDGSTVMSRSNSLDDLTEAVASEFLSMLESEASSGVGGMEPQYGSHWRESQVVPDHTSNFHALGMEHSKENQTEALMRDRGLNEEAFGSSPHRRGFGSPIELPSEGEPKSLGEPKVKDSWSHRHLWRL